MWIGRRAPDKHTYPDQLDNLIGGGQPAGMGLMDNLMKEAEEEASIPPELAARAVPVGAVSYCLETEEGLRPDVLFCYDLDLPRDFVPVNRDGEVAEFQLWPMDRVLETVAETRDFKFNCNLVCIDFAVRRGFVPPDDPDYLEIAQGLRR
jgi:8-oxo-dGTP pyrophosphatase MutT (NUDIX family)